MIETSVIVPVYNLQEYIENTLRSILSNDYKDLELIVIDDGSNDNTSEIIRKMQKDDERIILFSQSNGGVSAARNKGLELARGEYIAFIDGDDIVEQSYLSELITMIKDNHLDWAACAHKDYCIGNEKDAPVYRLFNDNVCLVGDDAKSISFAILKSPDTGNVRLPSVCMSIYRKSIIDNHTLRFDEGITFGEDTVFNLEFSRYINGFGYVSKPLYHVIKCEDSSQALMNEGGRMAAELPLIHRLDSLLTEIRGGWAHSDLIYFFFLLTGAIYNDVLVIDDPAERRKMYDNYKLFLKDDVVRKLLKSTGIEQVDNLHDAAYLMLIKTKQFMLMDILVRAKSLLMSIFSKKIYSKER